MRWLNTVMVALAMLIVMGGPTEARTTKEVRRITSVDPVTRVRRTEVVKTKIQDRDRHWSRRHASHRRTTAVVRPFSPLGAPVAVSRGFPRFPPNGQRVWRAGRLWEFERSLGRWIIIR